MIVVADTSPLNYLVRLGHPDILQLLYERIVVPPAVLMEMQHQDAPPEVRSWASVPPAWLEERPALHLDATLSTELGMGERQAISLSIELKPTLLLIDERAGRQQAEARNISIAGTLAILLQASLRGHVEFSGEMKKLLELNFRASPTVQVRMLARYEEAMNRS